MIRPLRFLPRPREVLVSLLLLSLLLSLPAHHASAKRVSRPPPLANSQQLEPLTTVSYNAHPFFNLARRWDSQRGELKKRDMEVIPPPPPSTPLHPLLHPSPHPPSQL